VKREIYHDNPIPVRQQNLSAIKNYFMFYKNVKFIGTILYKIS